MKRATIALFCAALVAGCQVGYAHVFAVCLGVGGCPQVAGPSFPSPSPAPTK